MKKFLWILVAVCVVAAAAIGIDFAAGGKLPGPTTAAAAETPQPTEAPAEKAGLLDYEAIYALHAPDEVVMTVGETEVTWGEYFYYLYRQAASVENYFTMMAAYGMPVDWNDPVEEDGESYLELTMESAETTAQSLASMGSFAESIGVELTEEDREAIAAKAQEDYESACGEGATREDFEAYLQTIFMPISLYDRMNELSVSYQKGYVELYGENGEKLSDEEAVAYLEENGYLAANHILFMTIDSATYEALDDETVAAKKTQAEAVAKELQAIADTEERLTRFAELKAELDEDTGKVVYPDGYVFLPGTMVAEFEDATRAQEAYQVSDPVESAYGYHVIMTLPLDPDAILDYSSTGTALTARSTVANEAYSKALDAYTLEQELIYAEGFTRPVLTDYLQ